MILMNFLGGLKADRYCKDMLEEFRAMKQLVKHGGIRSFDAGGYPEVAVNAGKCADAMCSFINN